VVAVALCLSFISQPALPVTGWAAARVLALGVALAVAAVPALAVLAGRGPVAICRFAWASDGTWQLSRADGRSEIGRLTGATAALGPWILLAWTVRPGRRALLSQRYALIGVGEVGPEAFRVLTGRLSLFRGRDSGASGAVAP
jgi:hypothetical protein